MDDNLESEDPGRDYSKSVYDLAEDPGEDENGEDCEDEEDELFYEDEGIPNRAGALPEDSLMDNLALYRS